MSKTSNAQPRDKFYGFGPRPGNTADARVVREGKPVEMKVIVDTLQE